MATNLTQIPSLLNISKLKKRHNLKTNQIIIKKQKQKKKKQSIYVLTHPGCMSFSSGEEDKWLWIEH